MTPFNLTASPTSIMGYYAPILGISTYIWREIFDLLRPSDFMSLFEVGNKLLRRRLSEPGSITKLHLEGGISRDRIRNGHLIRSLPHLKTLILAAIPDNLHLLKLLQIASNSRKTPLEKLKIMNNNLCTQANCDSLRAMFPQLKHLTIKTTPSLSFGANPGSYLLSSLLYELPEGLESLNCDNCPEPVDFVTKLPQSLTSISVPLSLIEPMSPSHHFDPHAYATSLLQSLFQRCPFLGEINFPSLRSLTLGRADRIVIPPTVHTLSFVENNRSTVLDYIQADGVKSLTVLVDSPPLLKIEHFPPALTSLKIKPNSMFSSIESDGFYFQNLPPTLTHLEVHDDRSATDGFHRMYCLRALKYLQISAPLINWDLLPDCLETLVARPWINGRGMFGGGGGAAGGAVRGSGFAFGGAGGAFGGGLAVPPAPPASLVAPKLRFPAKLTHLSLQEPLLEANQLGLLPPLLRTLKIVGKGTWYDYNVVELVELLPFTSIHILNNVHVVTLPQSLVAAKDATELSYDMEEHISSFIPKASQHNVHVQNWVVQFGDGSTGLYLEPYDASLKRFRVFQPVFKDRAKFNSDSHERYNINLDLESLIRQLGSLPQLEDLEMILQDATGVQLQHICAGLPALKHLRVSSPFTLLPRFPLSSLPRGLQTFHAVMAFDAVLEDITHLPPNITDLKILASSGFPRSTIDQWPVSLNRLEISTAYWSEESLILLRNRLIHASEIIIWGTVGITGTLWRSYSPTEPILELDEESIPRIMNRLLAPIKVMTFEIGGKDPVENDPIPQDGGGKVNPAEPPTFGASMPSPAVPTFGVATPSNFTFAATPKIFPFGRNSATRVPTTFSFGGPNTAATPDAKPTTYVPFRCQLPDSLISFSLRDVEPRYLSAISNSPPGSHDFAPRKSNVAVEAIYDRNVLPNPWPQDLKNLTLILRNFSHLFQENLHFPACLTRLHLSSSTEEYNYEPFTFLPKNLLHLRIDSNSSNAKSVCRLGHLRMLPTYLQSFECPGVTFHESEIELLPKGITLLHFWGGLHWNEKSLAKLTNALPGLQSLFVTNTSATGALLPHASNEASYETISQNALATLRANSGLQMLVNFWHLAAPLILPNTLTKLHLIHPVTDSRNPYVDQRRQLPDLALLCPLPPNLTDLAFALACNAHLSTLGSILSRTLERLCIVSQSLSGSQYHWTTFPRSLKSLKVFVQTTNPATSDDLIGLPPAIEELFLPSYIVYANLPKTVTSLDCMRVPNDTVDASLPWTSFRR